MVSRDQGGPVPFAAAYADHAGHCLSLARRVLRDEHLAEEVVQEVFLALWRSGGAGYRAELGRFEPWLATVTHHKAVDAVRSAERQRHARDVVALSLPRSPDTCAAAEDEVLTRVRAGQVRAALTRLPVSLQQVLALAYFAGLSQSEIAARVGIPLGTVKTRTRTALQRLRAELDDLDPPHT